MKKTRAGEARATDSEKLETTSLISSGTAKNQSALIHLLLQIREQARAPLRAIHPAVNRKHKELRKC